MQERRQLMVYVSLYRQLRSQNRIKLHVCLFSSFILESIVTVTWDLAVYLNRLQNERENTVMYSNSVCQDRNRLLNRKHCRH